MDIGGILGRIGQLDCVSAWRGFEETSGVGAYVKLICVT
jgi:hypothetical protein